ncbi:MAG: PepSY domain-containing protein [Brachymonas sp.]|nr:PepSY domain-containing protein [Brachymonas sp.]
MKRTFSFAAIAAALALGSVAHAQTAGSTQASISREQAIAIAQKQVPNSRVTETDFENKRKRTSYYEIDLVDAQRSKHEIKVNASTGAILSHEIDHDHDD